MSSSPVLPASISVSRSAIRHDLVDQLLRDIFEGKLPADSRLIVHKMAAEYGISTTPVREALVELESIGVVAFIHNRGVLVKPFGRQQLREIYQFRKILEVEATRGAAGHIDSRTLSALEKELDSLKNGRTSEEHWASREMASDRQLHELVANHCGSSRLAEEIRRYDRLIQAIREIVGNRQLAQQLALDEHHSIVKALLKNESDASAKAMAEHIDRTASSVEEVIFGNRN